MAAPELKFSLAHGDGLEQSVAVRQAAIGHRQRIGGLTIDVEGRGRPVHIGIVLEGEFADAHGLRPFRQGADHALGFVAGFFQFLFGLGIGDDATTGAQ